MLLPDWINVRYNEDTIKPVQDYIECNNIATVCESALCPNRWSCYGKKELTFMILGTQCTRQCGFCGVEKGKPEQVDEHEDQKILNTLKYFGSDYAVITSVTRDDLKDKGAHQFVKVINTLKENGIHVEVLIPDFDGDPELIKMIVDAQPDVIAHNVETISRLYPIIRPFSDYYISLSVLETIKRIDRNAITKTGFMMGLGENLSEIMELMREIRETDCDLLTVGQYLKPLPESYDVKAYIHPETFKMIEQYAYTLGFKMVNAAPFVRSSFMAKQMWLKIKG
ncbi:MAG: lipoyl synthase [bacterium]